MAIKKNFRNKVHIDFYQKLIFDTNKVSLRGVVLKLTTYLNYFERNQEKKYQKSDQSEIGTLQDERLKDLGKFSVDDLINDFNISTNRLSDYISVLSAYTIVYRHIDLYKWILLGKLNTFICLFFDLMKLMQSHSIIRNDQFCLIGNVSISTSARSSILLAAEKLKNASEELNLLVKDIQVELQNELLGKYYGRKLEVRKVKGDNIVLSSENDLMLKRLRELADQFKKELEKTM